MTDGRRLGVLGGTFDPIHLGHLAAAATARATLGLDRVWVVPSRVPPHRAGAPCASAYHRFAMVALAVQDDDGLLASDIELTAPGPSYTAATLARLRQAGWAPNEIFFITGADAFADIASWHDYPAVLAAATFVVLSRPGRRVAGLARALPALASRMIPASALRERRTSEAGHDEPPIVLVDAGTPDISATDIRNRSARGAELDGLVPDSVARYIRRHHLYTDAVAAERAPDPMTMTDHHAR